MVNIFIDQYQVLSLENIPDDKENISTQYSIKFSYCFLTLVTIGSNEFTPSNNFERYFGVIIALASYIILIYIIGNFAFLVNVRR
jgi:hypothetical protein